MAIEASSGRRASGGAHSLASSHHIFDNRSFHVFSRAEQLTGRIQGALEDLNAVVRQDMSSLGDVVVDQQSKAELLEAQKLLISAMARIRQQAFIL